jgi:hypothetical protein
MPGRWIPGFEVSASAVSRFVAESSGAMNNDMNSRTVALVNHAIDEG